MGDSISDNLTRPLAEASEMKNGTNNEASFLLTEEDGVLRPSILRHHSIQHEANRLGSKQTGLKNGFQIVCMTRFSTHS